MKTWLKPLRLIYFAVTLLPLGAMMLPWATLDGTGRTYTGFGCLALLASPLREYLYLVDPLQAAILTLSPACIVLFSVMVSYRYAIRRAIYWAPPILLAIALSVAYLTLSLVDYTHQGPAIVIVVAILLTLHQIAIYIWVFLRKYRRKQWVAKSRRILALATGIR